ncbi:unnamed protein product [Hermetia illucens]|uniref:OBP47-like domain-containing protein n=1 Tax=Hermetia illucens TaxID=343691 RepID=A0A7R8UFX4_HERIL|nr:general odorant-binding protein 68-like [Hermetia illucens]CAD7079854.1 unnamed protein product [Hermetia illucens]
MIRCSVIVVIYTLTVQIVADPSCLNPPPNNFITSCCVRNGHLRDIVAKCNEMIPAQTAARSFCHAECVFNETGLSANNVIQHDKMVEVTKDLFKDTTEFMPVIDAAMKKCKGVAEAKLVKINEIKLDGADKCHPLPALIMSCFLAELFINCPASLWQNTEECTQAKTFMTVCIMN